MKRRDTSHDRVRHPLCPYCHYDLVATVDPYSPRFVRCPECGEAIEPNELHYQARPGEWTPLTGVRNAAVSILVRALVIAAIWAALLVGMDAVLSAILGTTGVLYLRVMILPLLIVGLILGKLMHWKLEVHAGFQSWLVIWLAVGGVWLGLNIGHGVASALYPFAFLGHAGWTVMAGVASAIVLVYLSYLESA